ncbi:MAG: DUF2905 domain-containing protein [Chloroflexi bacterium]|nr:DUF2905 domain-containing protein [Chloroflexota bacterium]
MENLGRALIGFGLVMVILGVVFLFAGRIPWLGRLPGDIVIQRENFSCFAPIGTMLLLSLLLTIIVNVLGRFLNRE